MKKLITCLLLVLSLTFTACGSRPKYKDLERRIEALEQRAGIVPESTKSSIANVSKNEITKEVSQEESHFTCAYTIDDMSASQIFDEICYYFNNMPYEGESYEEIKSSLKAKPVNNNKAWFYFTNFHAGDLYSCVEQLDDCFLSINYGTNERMDGKVYAGTDVGIHLLINDYYKASDLYGLLYDYLSPLYQAKDEWEAQYIKDERNGTEWQSRGYITVSADEYGPESRTQIDYLSMQKINDYYYVHVYYRIP